MGSRSGSLLVTFAATALLSLVAPSSAEACGGMFCAGTGSQQVNQAAERIIFKKHDDGRVTAIVQILYDGPTDRFGWVLPVPSIPDVGLSSDSALTQLQGLTNPRYRVSTTVEGKCKSPIDFCLFCGTGAAPSEGRDAVNASSGGVDVLERGSTGPYDYVVIQVDTDVEDNVQVALDWLEENNYQATNVGPELLKPYLDDDFNLLAVRLQKNSDTGAIRPLRVTYEDTHPMIPIKLTAVAANEDMGVLVWVLGEHRAIPKNYKHLELNDAYINWFNPGPGYDGVVSMAANEASGQGFVTEYAQPTDELDVQIFGENARATWDYVSATDWNGRELELLDRLVGEYRGQQGVNEAIEQLFPDQTERMLDQIEQCGSCAFEVARFPQTLTADTMLTTFDDFVVGPLRDTQELLDSSPYITRLYTTMSAHEMTLDPSFDFNPDLQDVRNVHVAEQVIECHRSVNRNDAPWRMELPSGLIVRGEGNQWPFTPSDEQMPATISVRTVETSGPATIVRDNVENIRSVLDRHNAAIVEPGGCGCATTSDDAVPANLLLMLLGAVGIGLRRR